MRPLDRTILVIGALDLAYIAWVLFGTMLGAGFGAIWQSVIAFGLPYLWLQVLLLSFVYLGIFVCGLAMLHRRTEFAWLNYVLFPLRLLLVLPTLFPLFALATSFNLHPAAAFALFAATETLRVILVHRWSTQSKRSAAHVSAA